MAVSPTRLVTAGTELGREGQDSRDLLVLVTGWACRYKSTRDGHRQLTALLLAGDVSNLDCLLFDHPDYGVRMLTDGTIFSLSRERAQALMQRYPGIARSFTRLALTENAVLRQWMLNLGRRAARMHLAHLFCELAVRLGICGSSCCTYELPLNRDLLADLLGMSSIHVSRAMRQLRSEGLVATDRGTITLTDVERLRQLCDFDPGYLHDADDR